MLNVMTDEEMTLGALMADGMTLGVMMTEMLLGVLIWGLKKEIEI